MHHLARRVTGFPPASVLMFVVGIVCGGCGSDRLPTAPVEGKVLYQGKPLEFGSVIFQPDVGLPARGTIASDGTFRLSTHGNGDGAVIGRHRVRIACFESQDPAAPPLKPNEQPRVGRSLIPRKYNNPGTSGLRVEVNSQNEPFVFECVGETR